MDSGEKAPKGSNPGVASSWDILTPRNNGVGEFQERETDSAESTQFSESADATKGHEVDPNIIDAHAISRAWDPGSTDVILCNVLDEHWYPDVDDGRPSTMTIEERFEELRDREQFLDGLENHRLHPNPDDVWKYDDIDKTVAGFRENYLEYLEKARQHPGDPSYETMAKNAHNMLVTVRTYQYLASDPKRRRDEIEYDRAGLSTVLAKRDERYEAAFEKVDTAEIEQKIDKIINKIPNRSFMKLAKLLPPGEPLNANYIGRVADVALKALGLKVSDAEYLIDNEIGEYTRGLCRNLGGGKSRIFINASIAGENAAVQGGGTVAHETLHASQHKIQYVDRGNSSGEFYEYCMDYYIPAEFDYNKYASQYVEVEAFYFGNEFSKRIEAAQEKLNHSWSRKILGRFKRSK